MKKRIFCTLLALAITLYTIGNKSVYAFTLKYVPHTPSYVSKLYLEEFINSTGRDYVYLRVSTFTYDVSGAYFTVKCDSPYDITPTGISFKGTYKMNYNGPSIPKENTTLKFIYQLENYIDKGIVTVEGITKV